MKFAEWMDTRRQFLYQPHYQHLSNLPPPSWYEQAISRAKDKKDSSYNETTRLFRLVTEASWFSDRRPYYNVWPSMIEPLCRLPLDIDADTVRLPLRTLLVRLPVDHPITCGGDFAVDSLLTLEYLEDGVRKLVVLAGAKDLKDANRQFYQRTTFVIGADMRPGRSVNESLEIALQRTQNVYGPSIRDQADQHYKCLQLVCTLCLLGDNPDIIRPDVLSDDRSKYDETHDPKFVKKAIQRGKIGWDVGRDLEPEIVRGEVSPHYRRPHFGLRYCGEGGKTPRVVPIKGTVVRRGKLCEVPTGYLDAESV